MPETIGSLVDATTQRLRSAAVEAPRRSATRIVADVLRLPQSRVAIDRDQVVDEDRRASVSRATERLARGEPIQYATGLAGFRHFEVETDPRALIPRPETEGLVDRVLELCHGEVVVDVGTGTGCIALSLRAEGGFRVLAVDVSPDALALARDNRDRSGLDLLLIRGDLTTMLGDGSVDALVSNPPYLSQREYANLDPSVRDFEPALALVSGADGLDATTRLLADGRRVVRPGGLIAIEVAAERARECAEIATAAGWRDVRIDPDLFGRPRYLVARQEKRS